MSVRSRPKRFALALLVLLALGGASRGQDAIVVDLYEAKSQTLAQPEGETFNLKYRLLSPAKIDDGRRYPVVLFLHGAGERGDDNEKQLLYLPSWLASVANREKYPCFVIAPQCPAGMAWSGGRSGGDASAPLSKITRPMEAVVAILDDVIEHNAADPARIYLTGSSMGGYGSWDMAEHMPERFAAVAPICGGGDERHAGRLIGLPIWAWHGDADTIVPVDETRRMIAAIKAAGGSPKYTELKGVNHDSWTAAYNGPDNLLPWIFAQVKPAAAKP